MNSSFKDANVGIFYSSAKTYPIEELLRINSF
jgi:hypothetical protein